MEYGLDMDDRGAGEPERIAARRSKLCKYCFVDGQFVGPPGGFTIRDGTVTGRLVDTLFGAFVWLLGLILGAPIVLLLLSPFA